MDVIIPVGGDDIYRQINLRTVTEWWRDAGFNVIYGYAPTENNSWCKAVAVADALTRSDAEWIIVTDGDVWCTNMVEMSHSVPAWKSEWGIPHRTIDRMTAGSTSRVINGGDFGPPFVKDPYRSVPGGGTVMLRRSMYEQVPLDPRFVGWGQEDECWGWALITMFGEPWRGTAPMYHLWHEPAKRRNEVTGSNVGRALRQRYMLANAKPRLMSQLLAEV